MGIKFANNATTTLASGITNVATSMEVASGTGSDFPTLATGDYFYTTIIATNGVMEIVKVTDVTDDVCTIERAQESTEASAFSAGAKVENRMTAGSFGDMLTQVEEAAEDAEIAQAAAEDAAADAASYGAADAVTYDNSSSGLTASTVQDAIDEVDGRIDTNETDISTLQDQIGGAILLHWQTYGGF